MAVHVELVTVTTPDGVRLDGSFVPPGGPPKLGLDAVILHHGVGGNFYSASFFVAMQDRLAEAGCAVLRVNNRGHDLAYNSPAGRLGAAFEVVDDCRLDFRAWLDFAESRGFGRIGLWGHSLGAVKTIYFLSVAGDQRVQCAIASSPPLFSYWHYLEKEGADRFRAYCAEAEALIAAGKPEQIFATTIPTNVILAARTFMDKYGPGERYNVLRHLPSVRTPILVTIGALEGAGPSAPDWFPFGGLASQMSDLAGSQPHLAFRLIPEANHFYERQEGPLWSAVESWFNG